MTISSVVPFGLPSEFSPDPLTKVIQAGARELLQTAVQAEVAAFMAEHSQLLDDAGRQRLVRHGFLPEREVMTGEGGNHSISHGECSRIGGSLFQF
jgi:putative transposase